MNYSKHNYKCYWRQCLLKLEQYHWFPSRRLVQRDRRTYHGVYRLSAGASRGALHFAPAGGHRERPGGVGLASAI